MKNARATMMWAVVGAISFLTGVAIGDDPAQGTPGWQFGGRNCGCFSSDSATIASCRLCCTKSATNGRLAPEERDNCRSFCNQMGQPCVASLIAL